MAGNVVFNEDMLLSMMEAENNSRKRKSFDGDNREKKRIAKDESKHYQVHINHKNAAVGSWSKSDSRVQITQMRGNFWKSCGFTLDGKNYLYPEEALLLFERASISIETVGTTSTTPVIANETATTTNDPEITNNEPFTTNNNDAETADNERATTTKDAETADNEPFTTNNYTNEENGATKPSNQTSTNPPVSTNDKAVFNEYYAEILEIITLPVYLAYCKLKSLEYVTLRHNSDVPVRSFIGDIDVFEAMKTSQKSLLDTVVAYDVYLFSQQFSKKSRNSLTPAAYVIVLHGYRIFSARLLLRIVAEAGDIPIIFAAAMSTGYVLLEEFTDALGSLDWENIYAREISFEQEDIVDEVLSKSQPKKITGGSDDAKDKLVDDDDSLDESVKSLDEDEVS